jgi:hypothetical protein
VTLIHQIKTDDPEGVEKYWYGRFISKRKRDRHEMPCPPMEEQREIAMSIQGSIDQLDELTNEAEAATVLLQERRSALISAAVTGKIDVRGLVPMEAEAA